MQFLSLRCLALVSSLKSKFLRDVVEHGTWQVKEAGRERFRVCSIIYFIVSYCFMFSIPSFLLSCLLFVRLEPCGSVNYLSGEVAPIQLVALHSPTESESKSVSVSVSLDSRFQIVHLFATSSHLCNVLHNLRCMNLSQFPLSRCSAPCGTIWWHWVN